MTSRPSYLESPEELGGHARVPPPAGVHAGIPKLPTPCQEGGGLFLSFLRGRLFPSACRPVTHSSRTKLGEGGDFDNSQRRKGVRIPQDLGQNQKSAKKGAETGHLAGASDAGFSRLYFPGNARRNALEGAHSKRRFAASKARHLIKGSTLRELRVCCPEDLFLSLELVLNIWTPSLDGRWALTCAAFSAEGNPPGAETPTEKISGEVGTPWQYIPGALSSGLACFVRQLDEIE
ncbi:uncharacterized protein LOC143823606 [Paroedura picta]|uniref:uncharacterized protein LOC143823606 n=1 Tax=Paroedura picta TaxID=143630 RepID=UPI0040560B8D